MVSRGNFFRVDRRLWPHICSCGLNAAIGYLILSRGSDKSNEITWWSVNAIETHSGISRPRAKVLLNNLISAHLLERVAEGTRPKYRLIPYEEFLTHCEDRKLLAERTDADALIDEFIYLPNELIDGAVEETPPIERIRQKKSLDALRQLILIYDHQDLASDFGLHSSIARFEHKGQILKKHGHLSIWGFITTKTYKLKLDCALRHDFGKLGAATDKKYREAFKTLMSLNLFETVRYIVDEISEEGEVISPAAAPNTGIDLERNVFARAQNYVSKIAESLDSDLKWELEQFDFAFPLPSNFRTPVAVDIFRTRYRAKTKKTAAFVAKLHELDAESESTFSVIQNQNFEEAPEQDGSAKNPNRRPREVRWSEPHLYGVK